jgi:hypothetical protein
VLLKITSRFCKADLPSESSDFSSPANKKYSDVRPLVINHVRPISSIIIIPAMNICIQQQQHILYDNTKCLLFQHKKMRINNVYCSPVTSKQKQCLLYNLIWTVFTRCHFHAFPLVTFCSYMFANKIQNRENIT